jgi:hypothetical protein
MKRTYQGHTLSTIDDRPIFHPRSWLPKLSLFSSGFQYKTVHAFHHLMSATYTAYLILLAVMVPVTSVKRWKLRISTSAVSFPPSSRYSLFGQNALRRNTVESRRQHQAWRRLSEQQSKFVWEICVIIINIRVTSKVGFLAVTNISNLFSTHRRLNKFHIHPNQQEKWCAIDALWDVTSRRLANSYWWLAEV